MTPLSADETTQLLAIAGKEVTAEECDQRARWDREQAASNPWEALREGHMRAAIAYEALAISKRSKA